MARKTVPFKGDPIKKLPNDKPVVYKILSKAGKTNYTGVAQRGRVQARIRDHLPGATDPIPGSKVRVEQMNSIAEARQKEQRIIARTKPSYNKQHK